MKDIISKSIFLTLIVAFINFGFKIYLSYHISKEEIGLFYTLVDFVSVASLFFTGYKDSLVKVYSDNNFLKVNNYAFIQYTVMVVLLIPILYLVFESYQKLNLHFSVWFFLLFFIITQISNYYSYLNVAHRHYNSMLYEKSIKSVCLFLSFILLAQFYSLTTSLILSYILQMIFHIIYLKLTSPQIFFITSKKNNKVLYKQFLINYKLSSITAFLGSITIYLSAIVMFYLYNDTNMLAQYQVVVKSIFFMLVTIFVHPISAYTFPELSKIIAQERYVDVKRIDKKIKKYLFIFLIFLIFLVFLTKYFIALIFPDDYIDSYKMLNIMLPTLPFIVYTSFLLNIIKSFNRFEFILIIRTVGSILFFLTIYVLFLLNFNVLSIAYSFDVSFLGMFLLSIYYKQRLLK